MSRLLSRLPPPCYRKEDISLIGSIKSGAQKPQNERGKVNQRREITREKNEKVNRKRSREEHDKLHYLEDINNKWRHDKRVKFNESCLDVSKGDSDLMEKSDLSEEHDPPAFVLKQCYSLGSTQSSNILRDTDPNRKKQGLVLRIKLPSKKPKDPDTAPASSKPCSSLQVNKSPNIQFGLPDSCPQRKSVPLVQKHRYPETPSASRELSSSLQVSKSSNVQVGLRDSWLQRKNAPLVQKHKGPETFSVSIGASTEIHSSLQVTKSSNIQVGLRDAWLQRKNAPLVQKLKDPEPVFASSESRSSSKVTKSSNIQRKNVPSVQIGNIKLLPATDEDPCISGQAAQIPVTSEPHLSESRHESSRRHGRHGGHRARKSEKLFRDLILNWKAPPPPLKIVEADADDEDWLFAHRQSQPEKPSAHIYRAAQPEPPNVCQSTEISLQPRACYIPELNTFQLPYVIPF